MPADQRRLMASPAVRLLAMIIDLTTLMFLYVGGFFISMVLIATQAGHFDLVHIFFFCLSAVSIQLCISPFIFTFCYFVLFHSLCGRTIGKMCLGLQVVNLDGAPLSFGTSFLRYVGYLVSALPLGFGYLWAFLDAEGGAWHDKLSGTMVCKDNIG